MNKILGTAMAILLATSVAAFADTTAVDTIGVSYTGPTGTVALLGLYGGGTSITLDGGRWTVPLSVAGDQPVVIDTQLHNEANGGYLQYTLYGVGTQKITVQKDNSTAPSYVADSLKVKILSVVAGGSSYSTLGVPVEGYIDINDTPTTLITIISGDNTWTGDANAQGAHLGYQLVTNPHTTAVNVLYTLIATGRLLSLGMSLN